jgi:hypothetical protein
MRSGIEVVEKGTYESVAPGTPYFEVNGLFAVRQTT